MINLTNEEARYLLRLTKQDRNSIDTGDPQFKFATNVHDKLLDEIRATRSSKDFIHIESRLPKVDGIYETILFDGRRTRVKFKDKAFRLIQNDARVEDVKYWKEKDLKKCGDECLEGYKQTGTIVEKCEDCKDPALLNAKNKDCPKCNGEIKSNSMGYYCANNCGFETII